MGGHRVQRNYFSLRLLQEITLPGETDQYKRFDIWGTLRTLFFPTAIVFSILQ